MSVRGTEGTALLKWQKGGKILIKVPPRQNMLEESLCFDADSKTLWLNIFFLLLGTWPQLPPPARVRISFQWMKCFSFF